jgi:hypothetical protein
MKLLVVLLTVLCIPAFAVNGDDSDQTVVFNQMHICNTENTSQLSDSSNSSNTFCQQRQQQDTNEYFWNTVVYSGNLLAMLYQRDKQ